MGNTPIESQSFIFQRVHFTEFYIAATSCLHQQIQAHLQMVPIQSPFLQVIGTHLVKLPVGLACSLEVTIFCIAVYSKRTRRGEVPNHSQASQGLLKPAQSAPQPLLPIIS